jgi:hypothetical protein
MVAGPPVRVVAERHVTDRLLQTNAVWPGSGQPLEGLTWAEGRALQRLTAADVVREDGDKRFYLYAPAYAAHTRARRQRLKLALLFVVAAVALTALLTAAVSF